MEEQISQRILRPRARKTMFTEKSQYSTDLEIPILNKEFKPPGLVKYERLITEYRMNQDVAFALQRIATSQSIPMHIKKHPLLKHICDVSTDFFLNLMEITTWACVLERYVWRNFPTGVRHALSFAAYATKVYLNSSVPKIFDYIVENRIPGFTSLYNTWLQQEKIEINFSPRVINRKFNELTQVPNTAIIDYNFYVDDILQSYTNHNEEEEYQPMAQAQSTETQREYPALIKLEQPTIPMDVEEAIGGEELLLDLYSNYCFEPNSFMSIESIDQDKEKDDVATNDQEGEVLVLEKTPSLLEELWKPC